MFQSPKFFAFLSFITWALATSGPVYAVPKRAPPAPAAIRVPSVPQPAEIFLDAVVATVNDKPITLSELSKRLVPPRKLSFKEAGQDQEAQKVLDGIILERLIEEEASEKRFSVSEAEIDDYVNEVSSRNGLSRPEFEKALATEGKDLEGYKHQVKFDILKTKLAGAVSRGGVSVSDSEIDEYTTEHPNFTRSGIALRLRQILVTSHDRSEDDVKTRVGLIMEDLADNKRFEDVARHYSEGVESQDGGLIGLVAEKDLSREILDAVSTLKEGTCSKPIVTSLGTQIFFVEQRIGRKEGDGGESDDGREALRAEVRRLLQQQKTQERLNSYFVTDLYKNHSVDKKI